MGPPSAYRRTARVIPPTSEYVSDRRADRGGQVDTPDRPRGGQADRPLDPFGGAGGEGSVDCLRELTSRKRGGYGPLPGVLLPGLKIQRSATELRCRRFLIASLQLGKECRPSLLRARLP